MDEHVRFSSPLTRDSEGGELHDAAFVISRAFPLTALDLARMDALVGATSWGVGYNHIDLAAATRHGIPVAFNPVFTTSVAEAGLTLILALAKRLPELTAAARAGASDVAKGAGVDRNTEIADKTMVIVGYGRIGRKLGELGAALGMRVVAVDPEIPATSLPAGVRAATLSEALPEADVLVLVLPLTPETHHIIGARALAAMKATAYLVNVGRGGLVDEVALLRALEAGRLGGAGLDVWEHEPPDPADPLLALPNVIGTAHALARTNESLARICAQVVFNTRAALAGRPMRDVLNPEVMRRGA
jgi:phosphoglycerate dehydrogenase-like enzyme